MSISNLLASKRKYTFEFKKTDEVNPDKPHLVLRTEEGYETFLIDLFGGEIIDVRQLKELRQAIADKWEYQGITIDANHVPVRIIPKLIFHDDTSVSTKPYTVGKRHSIRPIEEKDLAHYKGWGIKLPSDEELKDYVVVQQNGKDLPHEHYTRGSHAPRFEQDGGKGEKISSVTPYGVVGVFMKTLTHRSVLGERRKGMNITFFEGDNYLNKCDEFGTWAQANPRQNTYLSSLVKKAGK